MTTVILKTILEINGETVETVKQQDFTESVDDAIKNGMIDPSDKKQIVDWVLNEH